VAKPKVMVALRDEDSAQSLATLACQLSKAMDAELIALHVVELPAATPLGADDAILDRPGKEVLSRAQAVAQQFAQPLSTRLIRARHAGEAIVGEARDQSVELLIVGHHQHAHVVGDFLLGSAARYVAHNASCRVIVQIPPP
jgi:APA family basic amino acid/polyamine antiporter